MQVSELINKIEADAKAVVTKEKDISFNELSDMYSSVNESGKKELNITPDFQRLFRWSEEQQSRFIESLILELPIPPIFLIENEDLTYDLIDGLQRISTYLHFQGLLQNEPEKKLKLKLLGCDLIPEINGKTIDDLPFQIRIIIKRTFVRAYIIRKGSNSSLRYHMFKRLNDGGSQLSPQEIRNVNLRLLDPTLTLIEFIDELSKNKSFNNCIELLTDDKKEKKYGQELVIRYLAIKYDQDSYTHHTNDYMNNFLEKVAKKDLTFNPEDEKNIFESMFSIFREAEGENIFRRVNDNNYSGPFMVGIFEAFTVGIQQFIQNLSNLDSSACSELFNKIKTVEGFNNLVTGAGTNNLTILKKRIGLVENELSNYFRTRR